MQSITYVLKDLIVPDFQGVSHYISSIESPAAAKATLYNTSWRSGHRVLLGTEKKINSSTLLTECLFLFFFFSQFFFQQLYSEPWCRSIVMEIKIDGFCFSQKKAWSQKGRGAKKSKSMKIIQLMTSAEFSATCCAMASGQRFVPQSCYYKSYLYFLFLTFL